MVIVCLLFSLFFGKMSFSMQIEDDFGKAKTQNEDILDRFSTQKGAMLGHIFGSTAYIYAARC